MRRIILFIQICLSIVIYSHEKNYTVSTGADTNPYIRLAKIIVLDLYKAIGVDVTFDHNSAVKSLVLSSKGKTDAELFRGVIIADRYPDLIMVEEPLFFVETVGFYYKEELEIDGWDSFNECRVTYVRGVKSYENALKNHNNIILSDKIETAFTLLENGRVDIVFTGHLNGLEVINKMDLEIKPFISEPLGRVAGHHFVHIHNIDLVEKLNEQLKLMDTDFYMEQFRK